MLPNDVVAIALDSRKYFEDVAKSKGLRPTLKGLCSRASNYLKNKLTQAGHKATIQFGCMIDYRGWPTNICHAWVVFNNKYIIDLTATQFGYTDKVLVSRVKSERYITL